MSKLSVRTLAFALTLAVSTPLMAQEEAKDYPVARVNGQEIMYSDLLEAQRAMGGQAMALPINVIQNLLINSIADQKLVVEAARKENFHETEEFKARMKVVEKSILQREYLTQLAESALEGSKVQDAYDKLVKDFKPAQEINARHILLATEDEAKAVIKELEDGADFVEVAKEKSTGPSGPNGGDLGYFGKGAMVPEFETAAFELEKGKFTTEPVQTQFGFHVIKVEDIRETQAPTLDEAREELESTIANDVVRAYVEELRKDAEIVLLDEDGKEIKPE